MGKQYNKTEKKNRRERYTKRKKAAVNAKFPTTAASKG